MKAFRRQNPRCSQPPSPSDSRNPSGLFYATMFGRHWWKTPICTMTGNGWAGCHPKPPRSWTGFPSAQSPEKSPGPLAPSARLVWYTKMPNQEGKQGPWSPRGPLFLPPGGGLVNELSLKRCILPPSVGSPMPPPSKEGSMREETLSPACVSAQKPTNTPIWVSSTHLLQLERQPIQGGQDRQKRASSPLHPSPRPLGTASCAGTLGIWKLICTPSTRPAGSQRRRDRSTASTKDGHRWCRLLPAPPLLALAPPGGWTAMQGAEAPRGNQGFPPMSWATPCSAKDSPCPPAPSGVVPVKGIKAGWLCDRALLYTLACCKQA